MSSKRSNLIDVTYQQLHSTLSGSLEYVTPEQVSQLLLPRVDQLRNLSAPFGKPSDASRKKIDGAAVTLSDGIVIQVDPADKDFIFAISDRFQIDEVQALILLRSFLYNEGLPSHAGSDASTSLVDELLEAIIPFLSSERLSVMRVLIPLFRANENASDPVHDVAVNVLPILFTNGRTFAESLIMEYTRKTQEKLPENVNGDPGKASRWAKQNNKEQLVMLEVLFWTMWGYVSCDGPLVSRLFEVAYDTNLGSNQQNSTLLLDDEGMQLQQDCAALWILITVEVLELEQLAEPGGVEISANPVNADIYTASPDSLKRIHELVTSHGSGQYACTYLAWAFVLSRLTLAAGDLKEIPDSYRSFFDSLSPGTSYSKGREPTHVLMSRMCLDPDVGLFKLILTLLTNSPLFVTAVAWKTGSTVTDPNAIAFRSVLKGLIIALVELIPVELIPDFDSLVEVWIALFGRSESRSIAGICKQFWESDWNQGIARRAIFDVARSRFPIHFKPLVTLLRAMTATGFLSTDTLSTTDYSHEGDELDPDHDLCTRHVFYYLDKLSTYSQVIPTSACTGAHALYEKVQERYGSPMSSAGLTYVTLKSTRLPGGTTLPARSTGRLLTGDGGDFIVVCWQHEHSGWKVILEVLTDYVNRTHPGTHGAHQEVSFGRRGGSQPISLRLENIGVEINGRDDDIVTCAFDLLRSVMQDNVLLAEELLESLETGDPVVAHTATDAQPPDLVQLTTMILEEALSRSTDHRKHSPPTRLITSAMSVLSALLGLPRYSNRVWLYVRSTSVLFGSGHLVGCASGVLSAERVTGHYTTTLALLHLVQQLFREASSSVLAVLPDNARLQQVKEEVLMRAMHFVHSEIWVEHLGWKYAQLGDKFEIGRRVSSFYADILIEAPSAANGRPFSPLSRAVTDLLLYKATTSTINPLVSSITATGSVLRMLYSWRRYGDARRLIFLLESHLRLARLVLNYKQTSTMSSKPCLLEQALCAQVTGGANSLDSDCSKIDPVEVLATYVTGRDMGNIAPLEAIRVLSALCSCLSSSQPSPPTIISHLSDPEAVVSSLVRIVQHPYDELSLRNAVWNFISLAVDKEPALASLFVDGQFRIPSHLKGKGKTGEGEGDFTGVDQKNAAKSKPISAIEVARDTISNWKELWELNPQLLASVLRFLDVVWQHGSEHFATLAATRQDTQFWNQLASISCEELGPVPDYKTEASIFVDGIRHSQLNEPVSIHAYRTMVKSYALHLIGLDIGIHLQSQNSNQPDPQKSLSYLKIEGQFKSEEQLMDLVSEAAPSSYDPQLYDELSQYVEVDFPALTLDELRSQVPLVEREFGDDFVFSTPLLQTRLQLFRTGHVGDDGKALQADEVENLFQSINLNLSLAHSQMALLESWQFLLRQVIPYTRSETTVRSIVLAIATSVSFDIASEKRSGDMMATIHGARLSLLLALLEVAWFSTADTIKEIQSFIELVSNVHKIILNESQPPAKSFFGSFTVPFHRTLLQIIYFCSRHCRALARRPKALRAEHRLAIASMHEAALTLIIDALRIVFDMARSRVDIELDRDMELLVAIFEQCTRPEVNASSTLWLVRCQETDVIKASLDLFVRTDLVGLSDLPLLLARRKPLYAPHILLFHMALTSIPSAAERFASAGVLVAYSNNSISTAISAGMIDVAIPELPGERSPAHRVYCSMIAVVAGVVGSLGRGIHYFDTEASGFVQLYGDQISRALSWTIGDPLTFPLLEEIEQVVNLFYSIAENTPSIANINPAVEKVLRVFTTHALLLLQQLNYALTHPNHLASMLEPVTADERAQIEKDVSQCSSDPLRRPLITRLVHRLFTLTSVILSTLISISQAESVLIGQEEDWPLHEALIVPHSKVVVGEPASLGTLLELGNCALDVLRDLVGRPAGQTITPIASPSDSNEAPLDVRQATLTARRNLEVVLIYATTQLVMWLSKPEFDTTTTEIDSEEQVLESHRGESSRERRAPRPSLTLAERLRRGMTGEMAADLQSLLNNSKPEIAKSEGVLGPGKVDLSQVLSNFLHERIVIPA